MRNGGRLISGREPYNFKLEDEKVQIPVSAKAFSRLDRARQEGESFSDVIIRLSTSTLEGLQRRGEQEVVTEEGRRVILSIDQKECLGAMSCVQMAPSVFAYDTTWAGRWRKRQEPLGMMEVEEGSVKTETLRLAAEACPYSAISVRDAETGEQLYP